jgi:hypothetical protein
MKREHHVFIREFIRTGNKLTAYKKAYPETKGEALRSAATRLYNKPHIQQRINEIMQPIREKAVAELEAESTTRIKEEICTMQQRREQLAKIILGKWQVKKHIKLKDSIIEVYDDPSPNAVIRAIDLDSRLAANKYKEKGIEYKKAEDAIPATKSMEHLLTPEEKDALLPLDERLLKYPYGHAYWKGKFIRLHGSEVQKYGFDILEEGVPYLKGELTETYKEIRLQKDIEDFRQRFPEQAKEIFDNKPCKKESQENSVTVCNQTDTYFVDNKEDIPATNVPQKDPVSELWLQYNQLEPNFRFLAPELLKQKETNFRNMTSKAQRSLLRPLLESVLDEKTRKKVA